MIPIGIFVIIGASLIIIIESYKKWRTHFMLKRVFNLKKELKNVKEKPYKPVSDNSEGTEKTYIGLSQNKKEMRVLTKKQINDILCP